MTSTLSTTYKFLFAALCVSLSLVSAKADVFAYVPNISTKYLEIYNTTLNLYVDSVKLLGSPRNVQVNHDGSLVFVSTVASDSSGASQSYLHTINTVTYEKSQPQVIPLDGKNVRGLVISNDDRNLYIVHEDGVTLVNNPGSSNNMSELDLTYSGLNLTLSDDNDYLFVIGTNGGSDGVSVVELATFTEITSLDLGINKGANEIVFSKEHFKLFVANSISDEVVPIQINNYSDPENLSLEAESALSLATGANPVDLKLHNNGTELIVVLSYIATDQSGPTGQGSIIIVKTDDITVANTDLVNIVGMDAEGSMGGNAGGIIHPLAINIDDNNNIYLLKQIWSDVTGIYVVKLKDSTDFTGKRTIEKQSSYNLGNKVSTLANGQFIGPDCEDCPDGADSIFDPVERPAAFNPFSLLIMAIFIYLLRRRFVNR